MKYALTLELGRAMLPLVRTVYGPIGAEAPCRQGYFWVMDARTEGDITVAEALPMWTSIPVTWGGSDGPHCGAIRKARWLDLSGIDGPRGAVALVQLFKPLDATTDSPWWRTPSAHLVLAFDQRWQPKLDAAPGRPASPAKLLEVVAASLRAAPYPSRRRSSSSSAVVSA